MTRDANDLQFAIETVRAAGAQALRRLNARDFERQTKADGTLVTSADLEANEMPVAAIGTATLAACFTAPSMAAIHCLKFNQLRLRN